MNIRTFHHIGIIKHHKKITFLNFFCGREKDMDCSAPGYVVVLNHFDGTSKYDVPLRNLCHILLYLISVLISDVVNWLLPNLRHACLPKCEGEQLVADENDF